MEEDLGFRVDMLIRHAQSLAVDLEQNHEVRAILLGYVKYLLGDKPRSYPALAEFLEYYGKEALWPVVMRVLEGTRWKQIIELGPGTGWLIGALGAYVDWGGKRYAFDKRTSLLQPMQGVRFIEKDLEKNPEFMVLTNNGPEDTLVVANQFLHCVDNWHDIIRINKAAWLVTEVISGAWMRQMRVFGANPISPKELSDGFRAAGYQEHDRRSSQTLVTSLWRPR